LSPENPSVGWPTGIEFYIPPGSPARDVVRVQRGVRYLMCPVRRGNLHTGVDRFDSSKSTSAPPTPLNCGGAPLVLLNCNAAGRER